MWLLVPPQEGETEMIVWCLILGVWAVALGFVVVGIGLGLLIALILGPTTTDET